MKSKPFGCYWLLERIGRGGMAEVFRAVTRGMGNLERLVAIKRINASLANDDQFVGMFIDEANIAARLNHENIAQIYDLGRVDGQYYIALEHVHGRDLRSIFRRHEGIGVPAPQALNLVMKLCAGLDYAHKRKDPSGEPLELVHRDVSLHNVIVSFEGEVKVIDFGIAKAVGRTSTTQAGMVKGKYAYMSPEQLRGLPLDRRSDVFACGIILYELVTGTRLFVAEDTLATLRKVRDVDITPPREVDPDISPALERIILKALSKHVDERYQSAGEMHDDLLAYAQHSGQYASRQTIADWMTSVFADEYAAETSRIAAIWGASSRPQTAEVFGAPDDISFLADPEPFVESSPGIELLDADPEPSGVFPAADNTIIGWVPATKSSPAIEIANDEEDITSIFDDGDRIGRELSEVLFAEVLRDLAESLHEISDEAAAAQLSSPIVATVG
jgi:serine/threonine protein kinase